MNADHTDISSEKTYDSVFWTGVVKLTEYFVPLVNEAFGEHFTQRAAVRLKPNKHVVRHAGGALAQRNTDTLAEVSEMFEGMVRKDYHFECQAGDDSSIAIRLVEYAAGYAFDNIEATERGAKMTIPHSAVIFLRGSAGTEGRLAVTLEYPGGTAEYEVPVLYIKNYTVADIFEKGLLLLLPFYAFQFTEKEFEEMEADPGKMERLKAGLDEANGRLSELVGQGRLEASQKGYLIQLTKRVLEKLTVKYKNVSEGVDRIMGGYIIRTEIDDILEEGIQQGMERGMRQGMERGMQQGIERGMQQGKTEQAKETAVRLNKKGKEAAEISEIVGFDLETVEAWLAGKEALTV